MRCAWVCLKFGLVHIDFTFNYVDLEHNDHLHVRNHVSSLLIALSKISVHKLHDKACLKHYRKLLVDDTMNHIHHNGYFQNPEEPARIGTV